MKKLITDMDIMGAVQLNLEKPYIDGNFEIFIPFRFVDSQWQQCIYSWFKKVAKKNGWEMVDYSNSNASFKISYCNDSFGKPEFTYEVFVFATPHNLGNEKPEDDPTYIFTPNLSNNDKKTLKQLMIQTITEQMMNMEG